jgi:hypothetical protein
LIRALEGHRDKGDRRIKVDVPDFHGRLHLEDSLGWLSSVEKFFDWKELSEIYIYAMVKFLSTVMPQFGGIKSKQGVSGKAKGSTWDKMRSRLRDKFRTSD